jgi:hypothetical protein
MIYKIALLYKIPDALALSWKFWQLRPQLRTAHWYWESPVNKIKCIVETIYRTSSEFEISKFSSCTVFIIWTTQCLTLLFMSTDKNSSKL